MPGSNLDSTAHRQLRTQVLRTPTQEKLTLVQNNAGNGVLRLLVCFFLVKFGGGLICPVRILRILLAVSRLIVFSGT